MDINLGVIELTDNQKAQSNSLKSEHIKGFVFLDHKKEVVVVSTRGLTEKEISNLKEGVKTLPDVAVKVEPTIKEKVDALWDFANGDVSKVEALSAKMQAK